MWIAKLQAIPNWSPSDIVQLLGFPKYNTIESFVLSIFKPDPYCHSDIVEYGVFNFWPLICHFLEERKKKKQTFPRYMPKIRIFLIVLHLIAWRMFPENCADKD